MNALTVTDPVHREIERPSALARLALKLIIDKRDLPFVRLILVLFALVIVPTIYLALPGRFSWWLAFVHCVLYGVFVGPYILMLHNTSHRKLFQRRFDILNQIIPWIIGPFFGQSPGTYYAHHIEMHHKEDNLPGDLSSTMKYDRDSVIGFARYFLRFFFFGLIELALYFRKQRRYKWMLRTLLGEVAYWAATALAWYYDWRVALVVFIAPFLVSRFVMMAGNWGQHAFVDASTPGNNFRNSISCINCGYNKRCFNDGYHIGHHLRRMRHWTEMPGEFMQNRDKYRDERAIVFHGVDFFIVWAFLMGKRYDRLAACFVDLEDEPRSAEEIIAMLKSRTRRIAPIATNTTDSAAAASAAE